MRSSRSSLCQFFSSHSGRLFSSGVSTLPWRSNPAVFACLNLALCVSCNDIIIGRSAEPRGKETEKSGAPFLPRSEETEKSGAPFLPRSKETEKSGTPFLPRSEETEKGGAPFLPRSKETEKSGTPFLPRSEETEKSGAPFLPRSEETEKSGAPFLPRSAEHLGKETEKSGTIPFLAPICRAPWQGD